MYSNHRSVVLLSFTYLLCIFTGGLCQNSNEKPAVKVLILADSDQEAILKWLEGMTTQENLKFEFTIKTLDFENEDEKICSSISAEVSLILDLTWAGFEEAQNLSKDLGILYAKLDLSISPALSILDAYLSVRNVTNVAVIFEKESDIDQALYYWINRTRLRMIVLDGIDSESAARLRNVHPHPHNYAIVANSENLLQLFEKALSENLVTMPDRWNLVFLNFETPSFDFKSSIHNGTLNILSYNPTMCCNILKQTSNCQCPKDFVMQKAFLDVFLEHLAQILQGMIRYNTLKTVKISCQAATPSTTDSINYFDGEFKKALQYNNYFFKDVDETFRMATQGVVRLGNVSDGLINIANFDSKSGISVESGRSIPTIKAFYRIGTTYSIPWSFQKMHPITGELVWTGYCLDVIQKMSEMLDFDYELVIPQNGTFGKKDSNGRWDGVVGDLARGDTDIAVAALIMTADREEVVDFVTPYYEETGISIVMRKPVRKTSLFKFMTVLRLEVWLSIVGALIVTGFMIWFLDKYSPYSAKNNKKAYPYPCRDFTLKESFWFALTSFTPQGGGEAPKALSGRTLVAAYWLFVVLMLATFTANLAAFLTVERMQSPVQSLEQLARQSRINYTVVMNSDTHQYFINMKNAEDTLYRMWKELTLNASTEEKQYRVWDYPIKEQYGHILSAINDSMPVASTEEGFTKVNERIDADFAFIHDSSEIKYEISRNCNFTEVGEVFAEKPYAIAIQQGSFLQDTLSKVILDMQKDRFFDELKAKYWNNSVRGICPDTDESEGITLDSLGGVFIATLFGLALAMVTLAGEVIYYRHKKSEKVQPFTKKEVEAIKTITIGSTFKPVLIEDKKQKITYLNVYPRNRLGLPNIN